MHAPGRFCAVAAATALVTLGAAGVGGVAAADSGRAVQVGGQNDSTVTPIQHLVVIFDENVSFGHYFGTYPYAANLPGEQAWQAKPGTPAVNGLYSSETASGPTGPLLTSNPNLSNPLRLSPSQPMTCDQDHDYTAEQNAADHGAEDLYPQNTGKGVTLDKCLAGLTYKGAPEPVPAGASSNYAVMDYYDGNTVTALWNYAQHYAMSANAFGTTYGPSTPGALNVTAAQTYGSICGPSSATINDSACTGPPGYNSADVASSGITTSASGPTPVASQPPAGPGTTYSDADPSYDICSYLPASDGGDGDTPASTLTMGGNNIGQELTSSNITWGWFEGGFDNGYVPGHGTPPTTAQICSQRHENAGGSSVVDYIPHHEPFQYFASTANPMHLPPTSVAAVGHSDQANHQYDTGDFWAAADAGGLPSVSYLKAPGYQDGHAGYSDPLDEQTWLTDTINHLESLPTWKSTAVVVTWDDSDGWYDSILGPLLTQSQTSLDSLTGTGTCGSQLKQVPVTSAGQPEQGRCGVGPRLPFLVISPLAKPNFVSSSLIDQSSVVKFIEYNWRLPALGNGAADDAAGSILPMFSFSGRPNPPLFLD
ncbi:MAG TPA: alkaline phosphatase family protein, partial [Streptosporangiaceae bacterium]|nr:alkaline phosphatase family protein [Streptosporangiaceae bacterium]